MGFFLLVTLGLYFISVISHKNLSLMAIAVCIIELEAILGERPSISLKVKPKPIYKKVIGFH